MKQKTVFLLLLAVLVMAIFVACPRKSKDGQDAATMLTYADYMNTGKRIGVQAGSVFGEVAINLFGAKSVTESISIADILENLRRDRIDAGLISHPYIMPLIDSGRYPDLEYLWVPGDVYLDTRAPVFHTEELREKYDEWFAKIKSDGTWDMMADRWLGAHLPAQADIPKFELTGENGTLRMCNTGNFPPFSYLDESNEFVGLDAELMNRFAQYVGMSIEVAMMPYEDIAPYVVSGKADMSACQFTITDKRAEDIIFGKPNITMQLVLIVPKKERAALAYSDFAGQEIAVVTGGITYQTVEKIGAKPIYYTEGSAAAEDVLRGRVAGYMTTLSAAHVMVSELGSDVFQAVPIPTGFFSAQGGGISASQSIITRFNAFLAKVRGDGVLEEMQSRWLGGKPDLDSPQPSFPNSGRNGILKVATCSDSLPYVFMGQNGKMNGFTIELALRFGAHEEKTVEFIDMEFGGLIPYVSNGKADIGLANMAITEERKKSVMFTDPFFEDQHGILALKTKGAESATAAPTFSSYTDFADKKIGVTTGSICDVVAQDNMGATPIYYTNDPAGLEDVRRGRIDGFMVDLSAATIIAGIPGGEMFQAIAIPAEIFIAPMGAMSNDQNIINRFNTFLGGLKADGTLDEMQARWLNRVPDLDSPMPELSSTGKNGVLRVATTGARMPFSYVGSNATLKGYSIELIQRFAAHEEMNIEFATMDFGGLIPYIVSGKADIAIDNVSITEERKKSITFSDSIYDDQLGILALKGDNKDALAVKTGGAIGWIKTGIERNLITDNRWKMVTRGFGVTMTISLAAQVLGTVLGCLICFMLMRKRKLINTVANLYCGLIHGTPMVVLLMITYYIVFGKTNISSVLVAIVAFAMVVGAGVAQNLKGAIDTVDPVEIEASRSLGFTPFKAFASITLPQAVRRALPGYTNGFVELVKATAIVGYIAIQDLTRAGDIIRSRTYDAYFPLIFIALIYLIVTTICVKLFKLAVNKINGESAP